MLYPNHTTNNIHSTPTTNTSNSAQQNHTPAALPPPTPIDGLDILEEECDSYNPTDTVLSESPSFSDSLVRHDEDSEEEDTAEELPPESPEQHNSLLQSRVAEDSNVPLDVKIPRRKVPMAQSTALPLHVNVMRGIVLACLFVLLLLSCLLIVVMESDSSLFSDIRKLPEMIILRREYYEPAKDYIVDQMNFLFKR